MINSENNNNVLTYSNILNSKRLMQCFNGTSRKLHHNIQLETKFKSDIIYVLSK